MKHKICPHCKTRIEYDDPKRAIVCPNCLSVVREDKRAVTNEGKCDNYISKSLEYVTVGNMVKAFEWAVKATLIDSRNERAKELKKNCASYLNTACKCYSETSQTDPQSLFNSYYDKASKYSENENYLLALGYISLALDINPEDKNAKSFKKSIESTLKLKYSSVSKPRKISSNTPLKVKSYNSSTENSSHYISSEQSRNSFSSIFNEFSTWWPLAIMILIGLGFWAYYFPISFLISLLVVLILLFVTFIPD